MQNSRRAGFTVVELLIVIVIISMLLTLMSPALQMGRESARRLECSNSLRQIGVAFQNHEQVHRILPTNGWGYNWIGNPNRGYGRTQPGGWVYNVLPFMEETKVHDLGKGLVAGTPEQKSAAALMIGTYIQGFNCPTRFRTKALPMVDIYEPLYSKRITSAQHTDFAVNGGETRCDPKSTLAMGPKSFSDAATPVWGKEFSRMEKDCTGIAYFASEVRLKHITDGLSKTYCVGEKYLSPDHYKDGKGAGDRRTMLEGSNDDITRWGSQKPREDAVGKQNPVIWGSAHPGVFNMVFCDGSVHKVRYDIDSKLHKALSNRKDGQSMDLKKFIN
jgi:prepilin-type N-terminal cleavage/methylation domain-containing protein/prepilin-type processing-associated H-X9-DG protein